MTEIYVKPKESVLNLPVNGSVGAFSVRKKGSDGKAIEVKYIETHVGFAVTGDAEEDLLQNLAPVREVLPIPELSFNEIMQRDINDARVSTELVPYLLEDRSEALVKFFPPIIAVVLPTNSSGKPAQFYPPVTRLREQDHGAEWEVLRSGSVGAEAFEFRQMVQDNEIDAHNYACLKVNTTKCKLAIVDGQHRAMALLALYRNYKAWPADAKRYQDYYKRWAPSVIEKYDLSGIRLPVLLCTFPQIHEGSECGATVAEACRSVFLALNKNARSVSRARNYLLDDDDIIAILVREILEHIKKEDAGSDLAIRLWNFELDSPGDKRALAGPVAISGVMHLYSLIEFLMLNKKWHGQFSIPNQNLWKTRALDDAIRRLGAKDELGIERAKRAKRDAVERETANILRKRFWVRYGARIVGGLDKLWPYAVHNRCALELEARLKSEPNGATYHAMLFEGQGAGAVFGEYMSALRDARDEAGSPANVPPELKASIDEFERKDKEREKIESKFYLDRTERFLDKSVASAKAQELDGVVRDMFRNVFTTEAFQNAVFMTFFSAVEHVRDVLDTEGEEFDEDWVGKWFDEYIEAINKFLHPSGAKEAFDIIRVFYGEVKGGYGSGSMEVVRSSTCLKKILIPGELKPDQWTRFRYLLLELWEPSDSRLADYVAKQKTHLRLAALRAYQNREVEQEASKRGMQLKDLDEGISRKLVEAATNIFWKGLKNLGVEVSLESLSEDEVRAASAEEASADDEVDEEDNE